MKKILLTLLSVLFLSSCQNQFNSESWLDDPEKRNSMVYDLLNKHELIGKSDKEIISLLGEPEQKLEEPALQYVYYLGRAGLGVDDSLLILQFDQNGKLESHKISHS
ncbi:lipoprotein [Paenibacillus radicis (ex Xue et al. 2023)]|uniref:Lipoprotein n=1 Tax=Paenibacillus radicis (ex Xue et al. 2023) TaxID=2972489 RepID=A0ABT1YN17_9BACL|nr:lipoprotein [Paenibacillus radicis (ex Xue et al. 2023)]MCR8634570.1 lipoprotein [Paenibacillus radicis (ex Xue et al. 2023)]